MKTLCLSTVLFVVVSSLTASPYWDSSIEGTTYQEWNFDGPQDMVAVGFNDYASEPILGQILASGSAADPVWEKGAWAGEEVEFIVPALPNTPNVGPDTYKEIYVEVGYRGNVQLSRVSANGNSYFAQESENLGSYIKDGRQWEIQRDYYYVTPNPQQEYICYGFNEFGTDNIQEIDYIHISTRCVPEPTTLGMLAVGGFFLRNVRRKN